MKLSDVESMWLNYAYRVGVPLRDSSGNISVQWIESRRAFYAGVGELLMAQRETPDGMTDDEGIVWLQRLAEECRLFWRSQTLVDELDAKERKRGTH